ncbi:MAG: amidohydrolase [Nitrospiraceae bacterium]|nr:MAG: amidohydrolase [Nitrospiraceae bacterium]
MANKLRKIVSNELFEWMREIRRTIHQQPELGFREEKTSALISGFLEQLDIKHKTGIAKTGVVGKIIVDKKAPTVALRADMDALPVIESTGLTFSSKTPGVMHACGHDGHVAIMLGAAAILKKNPPDGNAVFIFQPSEESEGGARPMIEEGALKGVDMIFGGHIEPDFNIGEIGIKTGLHTSYTDAFEIRITGKGGHAARPHETIDAVVIASRLVMDLQTIVSRETDPFSPVVITVGYINAGTVHNVIAEKATLKGTIRTIDELTRSQMIDRIRKTASSLSLLHGADIQVVLFPGYPPVINEEKATELARDAAVDLLGEKNVVSIPLPGLGGEDFAYYLHKVPGCFVRLGGARKGAEIVESHSPRFDFDEEVLRVGAAYFSELVRYALKKLRRDGQVRN